MAIRSPVALRTSLSASASTPVMMPTVKSFHLQAGRGFPGGAAGPTSSPFSSPTPIEHGSSQPPKTLPSIDFQVVGDLPAQGPLSHTSLRSARCHSSLDGRYGNASWLFHSNSGTILPSSVREHSAAPTPTSVSMRERQATELRESLAEEAALQAAVAQRRLTAVLHASRIATLRDSTAELVCRRDADWADAAALAASAFPGQTAAESANQSLVFSGLGPEGSDGKLDGWEAANDAPCAVQDFSGIGMDVTLDEEAECSVLSLEAAITQLSCLPELQQQVKSLEAELHNRTQEVFQLTTHLEVFRDATPVSTTIPLGASGY